MMCFMSSGCQRLHAEDMFPNVDRIGQVKCPVYIVHGTNDEIISYSHAEDLVRNCQEGIAYPPYMVPWISM